MKVVFQTERERRFYSDDKALRRHHGARRADLIRQRLDELTAADSLQDMRSLPGRTHELTGNLKGTLTIDLDGQNRLLFEPADDPIPRLESGGLDWSQIRMIKVLDVRDTHE